LTESPADSQIKSRHPFIPSFIIQFIHCCLSVCLHFQQQNQNKITNKKKDNIVINKKSPHSTFFWDFGGFDLLRQTPSNLRLAFFFS